VLYQNATEGANKTEAAVGDFDFIGTWQLRGRNGDKNPGFLGFKTQLRHKFTSISPAQLDDSIGSLWPTTKGFNKQDFHLTQLWWEQVIAEDRLSVRAGQIDVADFFDSYRFRSADRYFSNYAFSDNPTISFPKSGIGLVFNYTPNKFLFGTIGLSAANGRKIDFGQQSFKSNIESFFKDNEYFTAFEFGVKPRFASLGLGTYQVTVWHRDESMSQGLPGGQGLALSFEQEIGNGVVPFLRCSFSDSDGTGVKQIVSSGVGIEGVFGRDEDVFGIGLAWGKPRNGDLREQFVSEVFYRIQISEHIQLTPGYQVIFYPSNASDENAVGVLDLRLRLFF
jgi:porin